MQQVVCSLYYILIRILRHKKKINIFLWIYYFVKHWQRCIVSSLSAKFMNKFISTSTKDCIYDRNTIASYHVVFIDSVVSSLFSSVHE